MDEQFGLPVTRDNTELSFKTTLKVYPHTHKFYVEIDGKTVIFDRDEEGQYRASLDYNDAPSAGKFDTELLATIAETLITITK